MSEHFLPDVIENIVLADGVVLDQRQSAAILLHIETDMTQVQIAEQVGYCNQSALSGFLRSDRGREGVQLAIRQHLLDGARIGLQTMVKLARSAKSENVRQMAAADLLDRAGFKPDEHGRGPSHGAAREVNIQINMPSGEREIVTVNPDQIIEGSAE